MKVLTTGLAAASACAAIALGAGAPAALADDCGGCLEPTRHFLPIEVPVAIGGEVVYVKPGVYPMPGYPGD
jgi:hypothetical protein